MQHSPNSILVNKADHAFVEIISIEEKYRTLTHRLMNRAHLFKGLLRVRGQGAAR
jgi:hypothetical protein